MEPEDDYYKVLNVNPDASMSEIRRAYRLSARKYHPDSSTKSSSVAKFQKISEAYSILSKPELRRDYDRLRPKVSEAYSKLKQAHYKSPSYVRQGASDFYRRHQTDYSGETRVPPSQSSSQAAQEASNKADFRNQNHFERTATRIGKKLRNSLSKLFVRSLASPSETGMNSIRGLAGRFLGPTGRFRSFGRQSSRVEVSPFEIFPGNGQKTALTPDFSVRIDSLESILGTKREIEIRDNNGQSKLIEAKIPAGVTDGAILRIRPYGTHSNTAFSLKVSVFANRYLERNGNDITLRIPLTLSEWILGTVLTVPTMIGHTRVQLPPFYQREHKRLRLKQKGMQIPNSSRRGDIFIEPQLAGPDHITPETIILARQLDSAYKQDVRKDFPKALV